MPNLERIITIERPVEARDAYGSVITNWETLTEVWAEKRPSAGKERFVNSANRTQAIRAATWRIHYGSGVNELMRLVDEARRVWKIQGIATVGRRQYHDLICQSVGEVLDPPEDTAEAKSAPPAEDDKPDLPKPDR